MNLRLFAERGLAGVQLPKFAALAPGKKVCSDSLTRPDGSGMITQTQYSLMEDIGAWMALCGLCVILWVGSGLSKIDWEWVDHPFDTLPLVPGPLQEDLPLPGLGQQ